MRHPWPTASNNRPTVKGPEERLVTRRALSRPLTDKNKAARRWAPWLCGYTGAWMSEITQLRTVEVVDVRGIWCIDLKHPARTWRTRDSERFIPLHPHLIEQGFLEFV